MTWCADTACGHTGHVSESAVRSADGTTIATWANDGDGIPLLICNGLASSPAAWPSLRDPACGFDARTWYHRGIPPSSVPEGGVDMADHVADALAVVDQAGWDRYLVVGWSLGVNIALELAARDPRVAGVLALAGVPGGTFDAMLPLSSVPRDVATSLASFATAVLEASGQWLGALTHRLGQMPATAELLKATGAIGASADLGHVRELARDFLSMDVTWYGRLAGALRGHPPMDLSELDCPVVYVSAARDFVTDPVAVEAAAEQTPSGRAQRWDATHFLVLEYPDRVREALLDLAAEVGLA
jgi:3-oxoadipate enol-lactonase